MWRLLSAKLERSGVPPGRAEFSDSAQDRSSTSQGGVSEVLPRASLPASSSSPPVSQPPYHTDPSESEARGGGGLWKSRFQIHLRQWVRTPPGALAECAGVVIASAKPRSLCPSVCHRRVWCVRRRWSVIPTSLIPHTLLGRRNPVSPLTAERLTLQFSALLIQVKSQTVTIPIF